MTLTEHKQYGVVSQNILFSHRLLCNFQIRRLVSASDPMGITEGDRIVRYERRIHRDALPGFLHKPRVRDFGLRVPRCRAKGRIL